MLINHYVRNVLCLAQQLQIYMLFYCVYLFVFVSLHFYRKLATHEKFQYCIEYAVFLKIEMQSYVVMCKYI